jgi:Secretion system C-terminal sorting domain
MKTILTFGIFICFMHGIFAQKIEPLLFSSSGGFNSTGNVRLHYAIGETAVSTLQNGIVLSQGFYQGNLKSTGTHNALLDIELNYYPNPTKAEIQILHNSKTQIRGVVLDIFGRIVKNLENIPSGSIIDLSTLSSGQYFIRVQDLTGSFQSFKINKI